MDEDRKKYIISKTLIGDTIYYLARNKGGNVFARELTLEKLQEAIKSYKEQPPIEEVSTSTETPADNAEEPKKETRKKQQALEETQPTEKPIPTRTKQIRNELQVQIEQKRKETKKASFWDKLK